MYYIWFICLIVVFSQFGDCQVQWAQPMYQQRPRYYDCCSSALEEINGLLQIIKTFDIHEDRDCQPVQKSEKGCGLSEEIIMKLVNALIYTATQNCGGNGGSGSQGGNSVGGGGGGNGLGGGLGGGLDLNLGLAGGLGGGLLGGSGSGGGSKSNGGGTSTGSGGGGMRPVGGSSSNNNGGLVSDLLETVVDDLL